MSGRSGQAVDCFRGGFNCAQAVFSTFAPQLGVGREEALRLACGFGAGMGRLQETCGALSGAFLVLGARHGMAAKEDKAAREETYARVRRLADSFTALHGSTRCRELLGCDLTTAEGQAWFKENDLMERKCVRYVEDCARLLEEGEGEPGRA